jgi:hypothetical protein
VRDITGATTVQVIVQCIRIWDLLLDFALTDIQDHFIWKWTASGEFSSASRSLAPLEDPSAREGALLRLSYLAWSLLDIQYTSISWVE